MTFSLPEVLAALFLLKGDCLAFSFLGTFVPLPPLLFESASFCCLEDNFCLDGPLFPALGSFLDCGFLVCCCPCNFSRMLEYFLRILALAGFFPTPEAFWLSVDCDAPLKLGGLVDIRVAVVNGPFSFAFRMMGSFSNASAISFWLLALLLTGEAMANFFRCFFKRSACTLGKTPCEVPAIEDELLKNSCVSDGSRVFTFLTMTSDFVSVDCKNQRQMLGKSKDFINSICTGENLWGSKDLGFRILRLLFQMSFRRSALFLDLGVWGPSLSVWTHPLCILSNLVFRFITRCWFSSLLRACKNLWGFGATGSEFGMPGKMKGITGPFIWPCVTFPGLVFRGDLIGFCSVSVSEERTPNLESLGDLWAFLALADVVGLMGVITLLLLKGIRPALSEWFPAEELPSLSIPIRLLNGMYLNFSSAELVEVLRESLCASSATMVLALLRGMCPDFSTVFSVEDFPIGRGVLLSTGLVLLLKGICLETLGLVTREGSDSGLSGSIRLSLLGGSGTCKSFNPVCSDLSESDLSVSGVSFFSSSSSVVEIWASVTFATGETAFCSPSWSSVCFACPDLSIFFASTT